MNQGSLPSPGTAPSGHFCPPTGALLSSEGSKLHQSYVELTLILNAREAEGDDLSPVITDQMQLNPIASSHHALHHLEEHADLLS